MENDEMKQKQELFEKAISELEKRHYDYFKDRKSIYDNRQDRLKDHMLIGQWNEQLLFNWDKKTDVRPDIRQEAYQIYKSIHESKV